MCQESEGTEQRPYSIYARPLGGRGTRGEAVAFRGVKMEQPDDGVIEGVKDREGGREIIQLFGGWEIYAPDVLQLPSSYSRKKEHGPTSRVEDRRPDPRVHADERKHEIVSPHGVVARHSCSDLARAQSVGREVEDGEENGGRLLHARVPPKWPLAVVLLDR